jgi:hypothetical protein
MDDNCDGGAPACRWPENPWWDLRSTPVGLESQRPDEIQLVPLGEDGVGPQDLIFRIDNVIRGLEGPTFEWPSPNVYHHVITLPVLTGVEADYGYRMTATTNTFDQRITTWNYQTINSGNSGSRYRTFSFNDDQANLTEDDALFDTNIDASAIFIDPPFPPVPPVFHGATPRRTSWMSACSTRRFGNEPRLECFFTGKGFITTGTGFDSEFILENAVLTFPGVLTESTDQRVLFEHLNGDLMTVSLVPDCVDRFGSPDYCDLLTPTVDLDLPIGATILRAVGDLDNDGNDELLIRESDSTLRISYGPIGTTVPPASTITGDTLNRAETLLDAHTGDFDGDGIQDLVVLWAQANPSSTFPRPLTVFYGPFERDQDLTANDGITITLTRDADTLHVGEFDGDGNQDLIFLLDIGMGVMFGQGM